MRERRPPGVWLIIAYKLVKGGAEVMLAVVLTTLVFAGRTKGIFDVAEQLRHHLTGAWSNRVAALTTALAVPRRLWTVVAALALDAMLTLLEGLALVRGAWWGPWVVVVATSALLPFEIVALVRHVHAGRVVLLVVNVVIVVYLARRALAER